MDGPDRSAMTVRIALEQRELRSPGRANGKGNRILSEAVLALAWLDLPSRPLPATSRRSSARLGSRTFLRTSFTVAGAVRKP